MPPNDPNPTPNPNPNPSPAPNPSPTPDPKDKVIADLTARLDALEKKNNPNPNPSPDDPDLARKAELKRIEDEKKAKESKDLEVALKFSMTGSDWLKTNASLLPKTIAGIFEQAEKENYGSAIEKANAIKVGVISEFFVVQANLDLLTPAQKVALEDFQKLTKNGKQEKASHIYDMVFEPAFEMLKAVRKAEQLNKGFGNPSDVEEGYRQKIMKGSRKHYLGEKQDA